MPVHAESNKSTTSGFIPRPELFFVIVTFGWCLALVSVVATGYFDVPFTHALVFRVNDGWCQDSFRDGIGYHCFGDYGHPLQKGGFDHVYDPENLVAVNSPAVMMVFDILNKLDYRTGLLMFLALGTISCLGPIVAATRGLAPSSRLLALFFGGVGTTGFIASMDRANTVVLLPGLIWLYFSWIERKRWLHASVSLVVLSLVKFWAPILILPLVLGRKIRYLAAVAGGILLGYLVPMAYFPGDYRTNIQVMLEKILRADTTSLFQPYSISLSALVRRVFCALQVQGTCNTLEVNWGWSNSSIFNLSVAIALTTLVFAIMRVSVNSPLVRYTSLLTLPILAVPTAQIYNLVVLIPGIALLFREAANRQEARTKAETAVEASLALSMVPIALVYFGNSVISSTNGEGAVFRLNYWTTPLIWTYLLIYVGFVSIRRVVARPKSFTSRVVNNRSNSFN